MGWDAVGILARHGRSFRLAGRFLPRAALHDAAELYAFCRAVDDLADDTAVEGLAQVAARAALAGVRAALIAGDASHPLAGGFLRLRARTGASLDAALALVDAVTGDLGAVRIADEAALLRYAHGVAGTVGLMMCAVLGAAPAGAPHAADLGIAMQLTNIARDVVEDAGRDRIYLPATLLPRGAGPAALIANPEVTFAAVRRILAEADRRYRSAEAGYRHLPPRMRPAIRVAGRLYEEIGRRILRAGPDYLAGGRTVVPQRRKLALAALCLAPRPNFALARWTPEAARHS